MNVLKIAQFEQQKATYYYSYFKIRILNSQIKLELRSVEAPVNFFLV